MELNGDGSLVAGTRRPAGEGASHITLPLAVESTGAQLLVEFFSGEITSNGTGSSGYDAASCTGGFMANVKQLGEFNNIKFRNLI